MPIVHECADPNCPTLTMGVYCLEHEDAEPARRLLRRTQPQPEATAAVPLDDAPRVAA
jgi:hypothetical protein